MKFTITPASFLKQGIFLALVFSALSITNISAQDQYLSESLNRIVPISPNAASLGVFGSTPVGHHTGVPQISVPIHEIDFHGLKIPIELSYHASGVKVAQDASSVGLGWALNAGGCISRNILHLDDFKPAYGNYRSIWTKPPPPDPEESDHVFSVRDYLPFMRSEDAYDAEPDFFSYSFGNHSGSFFLQPHSISNGIASLMGKENSVQIKYIESGNKWEAIDAYGFKYIFGPSEDTRETTETYGGAGAYTTNINSIRTTALTTQDQLPSVTVWYLESIISPFNDSVKFKYRKERLYSLYQFNEDLYYRLDYSRSNLDHLMNEYDHSSISYSKVEQLLLSSIEYDGGVVEFGYASRSDLRPISSLNNKLTSISVYENLTSNIYGGKKRVKYCTLAHSYMGGNSANYEYSRLMLSEVCFMSVDNSSTDVKKYQFTYQGNDLPSKYSQSVDYWGYYNGAGSLIQGSRRNTNISPFIYLNYSWEWETLSFGGRDRRPDENYAKSGMLSSITYPTGGKTFFEFELNDFTEKIEVGTPTGNVNLSRGGGLRVKRIIDLFNNTDTVSIRRFVYQKDGMSSGMLKARPVHYRYILTHDFFHGDLLPYLTTPVTYINIRSTGFSSFVLNSGNVGYSYVEEHNVTNGKKNGYTAYNFINSTGRSSTLVSGMPTIVSSSSGKPLQIAYINSDGFLVKKQIFNYTQFNRDIINSFKCYSPPMYDSYFLSNNKIGAEFKVVYYSMTSYCLLESTITEEEYFPNGTLRKYIEYGYDGTTNLKNYQKTTVNGNVHETYIKYPSDFTDNISAAMKSSHMIGVPVETVNTFNGNVIDAQKTVYSTFIANESPSYLPSSIYGLRKPQPLSLSTYQNYYDKEVQIDAYDSFGNVLQYTDRNNLKVVYLWSCGIYPIAVIKNATVNAVELALGAIGLNIEECYPDGNFLSELQEQLPDAQVTLFTHKPQMGVTSVSAPSGKTIYYDYDGLGRLIHVKDGKLNKVESYQYNYSNK